MLKIYIDRLAGEKTEAIQESALAALMDVNEEELRFQVPIEIEGSAYLAGDHLVLHLKVETEATQPCSLCNSEVHSKITLDDFYHTIPLDDCKAPVYDYTEVLREAILLEIPQFAKCHQGCPEHSAIKPYLCKEKAYYPFGEIDQQEK
ncbi:MAG: hypothetical protein KBC64_02990 [Simkaniaceae bacterium]|nr:hypothetical protein [Simkaniaceae bacterium]